MGLVYCFPVPVRTVTFQNGQIQDWIADILKPRCRKMIEIAAACVDEKAEKRPLMCQVLQALLGSYIDSSTLYDGGELGESTALGSSNSEYIDELRRMAFREGDNTLSR
ncbi:hypothetical protein IFM89_038888 [Coptis chinensis]|uniref:Uncharacterized protein n=1 Tax=Coptis chinensis TaxID=261450 RepID=A0A835J0C5_9MAGN|nr:hypothetical protein IFM89_038888 [Coptis chinensis]